MHEFRCPAYVMGSQGAGGRPHYFKYLLLLPPWMWKTVGQTTALPRIRFQPGPPHPLAMIMGCRCCALHASTGRAMTTHFPEELAVGGAARSPASAGGCERRQSRAESCDAGGYHLSLY